jgi:hypothetical protein
LTGKAQKYTGGTSMSNDPLYPVFELLETRLLEGFYIKHQDDVWWLFNPDGEGHCSGKTLRELFVNLILVDG